MRTEYDFFTIEKENLKDRKTFPFQIFVFNPINKNYSLFLNGNRPLTNELNQFLDFLIERGGKIAILKKQRKTFLTSQEYNESDIPSLASRELHELEKERIMNIKIKEMYDEKNGAFVFQTEFEKACDTDNFEKIIEYARLEAVCMSVTESNTVSLAIQLANKYLVRDNYLNRIVSTCILFAKNLDINDHSALGDIICGAFFSHLGYTQLPLTFSRTSYSNLSEKSRNLFQKHTILASHIIKKSQIDLSDRCKKIINDHHERVNGSGYPSMKYSEQIEQLSLLVGAISHLFEYSSGKINNYRTPIKSIIINMKNNNYMPGLELEFGTKINSGLVTLINTDKIEEEKKAS